MAYKRKFSGGMKSGKRQRTTGPARKFRRRRRRSYKTKRSKTSTGIYSKVLKMPIPDRMLTKLRYVEFFDLAPQAAGSPGMVSYSFRNSIFDPNFTGLGHQPLWHDTLFLMYANYRVCGMKYRLSVVNSNTNQLGNIMVEHANGGPQSPGVGETTIMERRATRTYSLNAAQAAPVIIKGFLHPAKPYGLTRNDFMADAGFEAAMGANPTKNSHVNFYAVTRNSTAIFNCHVTIDYYVEFTNRILTGQS